MAENVEGAAAKNMAGAEKYSGKTVKDYASLFFTNRLLNGRSGGRTREAAAGANGGMTELLI
jgi:hypothetical protein